MATAIKHADDVPQQYPCCFLVRCESLAHCVWGDGTSQGVNGSISFTWSVFHLSPSFIFLWGWGYTNICNTCIQQSTANDHYWPPWSSRWARFAMCWQECSPVFLGCLNTSNLLYCNYGALCLLSRDTVYNSYCTYCRRDQTLGCIVNVVWPRSLQQITQQRTDNVTCPSKWV